MKVAVHVMHVMYVMRQKILVQATKIVSTIIMAILSTVNLDHMHHIHHIVVTTLTEIIFTTGKSKKCRAHQSYSPHSDIWICEDCSIRGDKWFMLDHNCRGFTRGYTL